VGDPTDPLRGLISAIVAKQLDKIVGYACAASKAYVTSEYDIRGQLAISLADIPKVKPDDLVGAMSFTVENVKYSTVSRDGDKATIAMTGVMRIFFDRQKLTAVLRAAGYAPTTAQIDALMVVFAPWANEGLPMDSTEPVILEGETWLICK
jgi:hypothetical protein